LVPRSSRNDRSALESAPAPRLRQPARLWL